MPDLEPQMTAWQDTKYYDPINDRDSIRITGYTGFGAFWISQPLTLPGKSRRAQREHLLYLLEQAIKRGDPPGEVDYAEPESADPIFDPNQF